MKIQKDILIYKYHRGRNYMRKKILLRFKRAKKILLTNRILNHQQQPNKLTLL